MEYKLNTLYALILLALFGCTNGRNDQSPIANGSQPEKQIHLIRFDSPTNGTTLTVGEQVKLAIKLVDTNIKPDSIILYINNERVDVLTELTYQILTQSYSLGTLSIKATAWKSGQRQTASVSVMLKSKIVPQKQTYRVVKTFNHDPQAYTQGLFIHNGFIYEGTGQQGASTLRKVELETGKVLQSNNLSQEYFGEGIALLDGKIYQLTWTSGIGFIYDVESFKQLGTFNYTTQGWGLTTNGSELIMSDGSNIIHFMNPNGFAETRRIEVFDNYGPIRNLNELEYIDGKIWANVYTTNRVVVIDPKSGAVISDIDLSKILKDSDRTGNEDVLNGIAYDSASKRIFVTGKNWAKLYEVKIINK